MSLLRNLKSLFVVTDDNEVQDGTDPVSVDSSSSSTSSTSTGTSASTISSNDSYSSQINSSGNVDDKFLDILLDAMNAHNKPGFDYLEFKQSLQSLAKMSMDEKTRFQSAFAMAQTMGATPGLLIDTANFYLDILSKEEEAFEDSLTTQRKKQIGEKESEGKSLTDMINQKSAQIDQLNKEIQDHKDQLSKIKSQIDDASAKIDKTKQNFIASYNHVVNQVKDDIQKMNDYLK